MPGEASAPASSANLGPGFDTIALALDLRCVARVTPAETWSVRSNGADPGRDAVAFVTAVAASAGPPGPLRVDIDSDVPRASGLGSSAAVAVAVVAATIRAGGREPTRDEVFAVAAECEGHPDNAAAATYGGLAVVTAGGVLHLDVAESLVLVVAVPGAELLTVDARAALPTHVPIGAAARNVALGGTLIGGIESEGSGAPPHSHIGQHAYERLQHIVIDESSRLAAVLGTRLSVNSIHHQAVRDLAPGLRAVAHAADGVVEAVEHDAADWPLWAVQWHPEYLSVHDESALALFAELVAAARSAQAGAIDAGSEDAAIAVQRGGEGGGDR